MKIAKNGLPLGQNHDARCESKRVGSPGKIPKQNKRFVEIRSNRIRASPVGPVLQVGPDHVVIGRYERVTQRFSGLGKRFDPTGNTAYLSLRKYESDLHEYLGNRTWRFFDGFLTGADHPFPGNLFRDARCFEGTVDTVTGTDKRGSSRWHI